MKLRFSDMQSNDGAVSIDVEHRIIGGSFVVTDFKVFTSNDDGGWDEVTDKEKARELFNKYGHGLIEAELNRNEIDFDYDIVS